MLFFLFGGVSDLKMVFFSKFRNYLADDQNVSLHKTLGHSTTFC